MFTSRRRILPELLGRARQTGNAALDLGGTGDELVAPSHLLGDVAGD